jgi:transcriptional regulator with GAF, ATPase, and Fis domain
MVEAPWFRVVGARDFDGWEAVHASLVEHGLAVSRGDRECEPGPGILCFSAVDDALLDVLRQASDGGGARVLALPAADMRLQVREAWELLRAGASDVLAWSSVADVAHRIRASFARWAAVDALLEAPAVRATLVGASTVWRAMLRRVVEVARFTEASVLLIGESGTGKELIARLIHELDARERKAELVLLDCSTIVPELSGSEFFGHERGAFTGAVAARDGAFATAHGGSLFLDEVGELPTRLQAQLLRVVQERMYKRVGGNAWHRTEFRLVSATNRDLLQGIEKGEFRGDLYHRIASWMFRIPPLRERRDDILPLARHFLHALCPNAPSLDFDLPVRDYLVNRAYPGNVRDLGQLVTRIASCHVGPGPITLGDIPDAERPLDLAAAEHWRETEFAQGIRQALSCGAKLKEISQAATETAIRLAVHDENGNLQLAARRLGVTDRALQLRRAARQNGKGETQEVPSSQ